MFKRNYLFILLGFLLLLTTTVIYLLIPSKTASAQQDDDTPLTEDQLVVRFTNIVNQEIPALEFKVENDGASEIKIFLINAARNFISENNFTAEQKALADSQIRQFAQRVKHFSQKAGTARIDEKRLVEVAVPSETNTNMPTSPANTSENISNNNSNNQTVNIDPNVNVNTNSNANFRSADTKQRVSTPVIKWRNSFAPVFQDDSLDFDRKKINRNVVAQSKGWLCPLAPICR